MPPNLDVYVISSARDRNTIRRFLDSYIDIETSEDRGTEELMMLPLGTTDPTKHVARLGLGTLWNSEPHHRTRLAATAKGIFVHLNALDAALAGASLGFTTDNQIVFGLSLDDDGGKPENLDRAKSLLRAIAGDLEGQHGFIGVETPPPLTAATGPSGMILYVWPSA